MPISKASRRDAASVATAVAAPADLVPVDHVAMIADPAPAAEIATTVTTADHAMIGADRAVVVVENLASRAREDSVVRAGRREIATGIAGRVRHRSRCVRSSESKYCRSR